MVLSLLIALFFGSQFFSFFHISGNSLMVSLRNVLLPGGASGALSFTQNDREQDITFDFIGFILIFFFNTPLFFTDFIFFRCV